MTSSAIIRRNSYDRVQTIDFDASDTVYSCDCGQIYMTEETLKKHQLNGCKNRSLKCSFCREVLPSSVALRDHFLLCGNKTDLCPNCRQLIRRSHFAYHYENNCAPIDEVETPPSRPKTRSIQSVPTNSNKPVLRMDIPADAPQNNYSNHNSSRSNSKSPLSSSISINGQDVIECEYCHHPCARTDYQAHKINCLQNPTKLNQRNPLRTNFISNQKQGVSNVIVHIPCEICQQLIDLPNWSSHTQTCRERENQRIARHADAISQQPITENFSCEYCQRLYPAKQLEEHERNCQENSRNRISARNLPRQRPSPSVMLPVKQASNQSQPISSGARSRNNTQFAQYQCIDVERTHKANKSYDDTTDAISKTKYQNAVRKTASNENFLRSADSRGSLNYGNQSNKANDHRSYENISNLSGEGFSNGTPERSRSSDSLKNTRKSPYMRSDSIDNRYSSKSNYAGHMHHSRNEERKLHAIESKSWKTKSKRKPSTLARFFGCASVGYDD